MREALFGVTDPVSGESLTPDLDDEDDPLIQVVNAFADSLAAAWEHLQLSYNQFDPLKATGAGLSGVVQLNGLRRRAGTRSSVVVTLTGTPNMVIPAGKQITTMTSTPVFELPTVEMGEDGTANALATCIEDGPFEVGAGTLVKILTPVSGWTAVTNALAATPGTYEETDEELRARQQISTSNTAQTIVESIASGVGALEGVEFVKVYQNIGLVADERGIPAKSIAVIVLGGEDDEIARAIFTKLAAGGADTHGTEEVEIIDEQDIIYAIRFSRPTEIPVYVDVNVQVVNAALWPTDGADLVKAAILSWAQIGAGGLDVYSQYDQDGYSPGQSVYASELFVPAYTVSGIKVTSISVGEDSSGGGDEVAIAWDEIAVFSDDNINVTVTT